MIISDGLKFLDQVFCIQTDQCIRALISKRHLPTFEGDEKKNNSD